MQAATFRKIHPFEYYLKFLEKDLRPDGRNLLDFREPQIVTGCLPLAFGSSIVKIGNTTVTCSIQAQFAPPKEDHPSLGFIAPTVLISPVCALKSGNYRSSNDLIQHLSNFLIETLSQNNNTNNKDNNSNSNNNNDNSNNNNKNNNSGPSIVDLEQLNILSEKIVWALYADITIVDDDGGLEDCCLMALLSALSNVTLPEVEINEDETAAVPVEERTKPLKISRFLVSSTFAVINEKSLIADPTKEERRLANCYFTIIIDDAGNIAGLTKPGGSPLPNQVLRLSINEAISRFDVVKKIIK